MFLTKTLCFCFGTISGGGVFPLYFAPFSLFFHFCCCSHYNMIPALPPPSSSHDHSSFRQKKTKRAFSLPKLISFFGNLSVKRSRSPIRPSLHSSLTIIKVPLSKALNPPPLLCICSVVSRQGFGCSGRTPRWTCLCINDCNEQQDQRHRSQLRAGSDSCTNP